MTTTILILEQAMTCDVYSDPYCVDEVSQDTIDKVSKKKNKKRKHIAPIDSTK
jgi:hypothetical protein